MVGYVFVVYTLGANAVVHIGQIRMIVLRISIENKINVALFTRSSHQSVVGGESAGIGIEGILTVLLQATARERPSRRGGGTAHRGKPTASPPRPDRQRTTLPSDALGGGERPEGK